jgi:putative ATP-binding cassette transporter
LGGLTQTAGAFGRVQDALSWFITRYADLAQWHAIVERLMTFHRAVIAARAAYGTGLGVSGAPDGIVQTHGLTLALPNGSNLLENTDLVFQPGQSVILTGRSGSGKSTLFRALAGIWPFGQGQVQRPAERCLFLPQRPYIPLGTLRHVVTYPLPAERFSRDAIAKALEDAGLPGLVPQLDREENWALQLSGGEQQRVALARALLAKPDWLFLDEATASLDPEAEAQLYQTLKTRLPHTTLISIAHRPSVAEFHERRLVLQREGDKPGTVVPGDLAPANGGGG